jgi:hypothetical protein
VIGKANQRKKFPTIFTPYQGGDEHLKELKQHAEDALIQNINILTQGQRTADWFTLRAFHLSATMAGILFNNNYESKSDQDIMKQLCKSWFRHSCSTTAMVIGTKNEGAVLNSFSKLSYMKGVFECGLLECKDYLWMAPDGIAAVMLNGSDLIVASIEIKTRVATEKIAEAQEIADKYQNKLIQCDIGDDTWTECVEKEHSLQVLLQLWVTHLQTAFYIVALPGTSNASGRIANIVMGCLSFRYANSFFISIWIESENCYYHSTKRQQLTKY